MHAQPPGGLFGTPSQLLSLFRSQVSFAGLTLHVPHAPLVHVVVPVAHGPTRLSAVAQVDMVPLMQVQPWLGVPSHVASLPESHVSFAAGITLHVQPVPLALQVAVPAPHAPLAPSRAAQVPVVPGEHGQVSLVRPLQLESSPVTAQLSEAAGTMLHGPQTPAAQVVMPPAHLPLAPSASPQLFVVPLTQVHPSLAMPLQLPSLPDSQVSLVFGPIAP